MAIYKLYYKSPEEAADDYGLQTRAVYYRAKHGIDPSIRIDGFLFIGSPVPGSLPEDVDMGQLQWVGRCAKQHGIVSSRICEQIIIGKITGVVLGDRVFVMKNEPALLEFLKDAKHH